MTLEELLGLDPESPDALRAELLASNDRKLMRSLVAIRRKRGLSQADVGRIMGISQPSVADFEAIDSNPTLGRIRRYAHAVSALIVHRVELDEGQLLNENERTHWIGTSIHGSPVRIMARASSPSPPTVRRATSGAASFPGEIHGREALAGRRSFALAA